jgi:hypothetical protein
VDPRGVVGAMLSAFAITVPVVLGVIVVAWVLGP